MTPPDRRRPKGSECECIVLTERKGGPTAPSLVTAPGLRMNAESVAALRETHEALKEVLKALIVVKGSLDKPYPERPEWSPWTRFVEQAFRQGAAAEEVARRALRAQNDGSGVVEADVNRLRQAVQFRHRRGPHEGFTRFGCSCGVGFQDPRDRDEHVIRANEVIFKACEAWDVLRTEGGEASRG